MLNIFKRYIGHFDCISNNGYAQGWIYDRRNKNTPVKIVLLHSNIVIGTGLADQFRADLKTKGIGDGRHGFCLRVPDLLLDKTNEFVVATADGSFKIKNLYNHSKRTLQYSRYKGGCEKFHSIIIKGWAADMEDPESIVELSVFDGNHHLLNITANKFRSDLAGTGLPPGHYGFNFELPRSFFDGRPHILAIKVKGEDFILRNCPMHLKPNDLALALAVRVEEKLNALSKRYEIGRYYGR